jgi:hypothetical protein
VTFLTLFQVPKRQFYAPFPEENKGGFIFKYDFPYTAEIYSWEMSPESR